MILMDCNIIMDLLPLYIDECCSEESAAAVHEHLETCPGCREVYKSMRAPDVVEEEVILSAKLERISAWKASVLQSVLLFSSFALIIAGVSLEAATPFDAVINGGWAAALVVPATGFMLSLANWYFVRQYKSRKSFYISSLLITIVITALGFLWAAVHYELFWQSSAGVRPFIMCGMVLAAVFVLLSGVLSSVFAKMLGKEGRRDK